jgi:simple sugar transport system permease protein
LVILGTWSPLRAILGAYLFGGVEAMQFTLQGLGFAGVSQFLAMLPYALAIFVLVAVSVETVRKRIGVPAALGVPYAREM